MRVLVAAFGDAGHAFPAIALARALAARENEVVVETWEKWRDPVEQAGLRFHPAEAYKVFPPPKPAQGPTAGEAALAMAPLLDDFGPDVVVADVLTLAPALAAERAGVPLATLVPHVWPVSEPEWPYFAIGMWPPRTSLGRWAWRTGQWPLNEGLRRGRDEINLERDRVGLAPTEHLHGGISRRLALVGTFPQLEYPRRWPDHVHVVGPLDFEMPYPDVELPEGSEPLVLVAPSTAQDREGQLLRDALVALADEPVRVIATTNLAPRDPPFDVPANAVVVDWLRYSQAMGAADLVICHGGHGTVARSLLHGAPVLVRPAIGDMTENGIRVAWAGCGLMIPRRIRGPRPLRWATRRILRDPSFAARAKELQAWSAGWDAGNAAAVRVEQLGAESSGGGTRTHIDTP